VVRLVELLMESRLHLSGLENLMAEQRPTAEPGGPDQRTSDQQGPAAAAPPTMFVANHFTRFETFLIPYVLYQRFGWRVRCLADKEVFVGPLGKYLRRMGCLATDDPDFRETIVRDLASGRSHWVIFPEGGMVKNKRLIRRGQPWIDHPYRQGQPHTGAAVFALQAELLRQRARAQCTKQGRQAQSPLALQPWLDHPHQAATQAVVMQPVTFTYYPLRPGTNLIDQTARRMIGELPEFLNEELQVEGNLLFGGADIDIHFSPALGLDSYINHQQRRARWLHPFSNLPGVERFVIEHARRRLTNDAMHIVYRQCCLNIDHILSSLIRAWPAPTVSRVALHQAACIVLAHLPPETRRHPSLLPAVLAAAACLDGAPQHTAWQDWLTTAKATQVMDVPNGSPILTINHERFQVSVNYQRLRLENPLRVMANEVEQIPDVAELIRATAQLSERQRCQRAGDALRSLELQVFTEARRTWLGPVADTYPGIAAERARPRMLLRGRQPTVILAHGFLACPREVSDLGDLLHAHGYNVILPRLAGHGTRGKHLASVRWQEWLHSYQRAVTLARWLGNEQIICAGFSMGGLLALQTAAQLGRAKQAAHACVLINAPMQIYDRRASFAPLVRRWNQAIGTVSEKARFRWTASQPEFPDTNYDRIYVHAVSELMACIDQTRHLLPAVTCPTFIAQSTEDPVVQASSATFLANNLGADHVALEWYDHQQHVLPRDPLIQRVGHDLLRWFAEQKPEPH
jgi:esterase/lipase/1-acyl-sn-glycerol-3-phosphate acyltransferase